MLYGMAMKKADHNMMLDRQKERREWMVEQENARIKRADLALTAKNDREDRQRTQDFVATGDWSKTPTEGNNTPGMTSGGTDLYAVPEKEDEKQTTLSALGKLINEQSVIKQGNPNDSRIKIYDQRIAKEISRGGINFEIGPDGEVKFNTTGEGFTKKTQGGIEDKQIKSLAGIQRISKIEEQINNYDINQLVGVVPKTKAWANDIKEYVFGKGTLTKEQETHLANHSRFAQDTITNINRAIKDFTGAQMSEPEAGRLRLMEPDAGDQNPFAIWNRGDSPTKFVAKLKNKTRGLKLVSARFSYIQKNGFTYKGTPLKKDYKGEYGEDIAAKIPLSDVPSLINTEGARIERELRAKNPAWTDGQITKATDDMIADLFGFMR